MSGENDNDNNNNYAAAMSAHLRPSLNITALPAEIMATIFAWVAVADRQEAMGEQSSPASSVSPTVPSMVACMQVCRSWKPIAATELYRQPECRRRHQVDALISTLQVSTRRQSRLPYATMVHSLTFNHFLSRALDDRRLLDIIEVCRHSLRHISLFALSGITDASLVAVGRECANLEAIVVDDNALAPRYSSRAWSQFFEDAVKLRAVELFRCPLVTDEIFAAVVRRAELVKLTLLDCDGLTDVTLTALLHQCRNLKSLHITSQRMRDQKALYALASRCRHPNISTVEREELVDESAVRTRQYRLSRNKSVDQVKVDLVEFFQTRSSAVFG